MIIGISTDKLEDQERFAEKEKLNFPLYADPEQKATRAYGVLMAGKPMAQRVTFVIDKQGVIRKTYTKVDVAKNPGEVLDYIKDNLAKGE